MPPRVSPGQPCPWIDPAASAELTCFAAPQPKELLEVEGGHVGPLYHADPVFDQVSAAQADFLF